MTSNVDKISNFLFEAHEAGDRFVNLEKDMKPKDFDEAYKVQTQLRQKLSKRWSNMLLESTVYNWCTIGDRVTGQSQQLRPPHELVRGCQP